MILFKKIVSLYPELGPLDFNIMHGSIRLQNDSDGKGDFIAAWEHPTLARPTEEQLASASQV